MILIPILILLISVNPFGKTVYGRSIPGNFGDGYDDGKAQGKNDFDSGNQHNNACPRDFWSNISFCTGYKIGYEAGFRASQVLGRN